MFIFLTILHYNRFTNKQNRKGGLLRMPSARKIGLQLRELELAKMTGQRTRCKDLRDLTLLDQNRNEPGLIVST